MLFCSLDLPNKQLKHPTWAATSNLLVLLTVLPHNDNIYSIHFLFNLVTDNPSLHIWFLRFFFFRGIRLLINTLSCWIFHIKEIWLCCFNSGHLLVLMSQGPGNKLKKGDGETICKYYLTYSRSSNNSPAIIILQRISAILLSHWAMTELASNNWFWIMLKTIL